MGNGGAVAQRGFIFQSLIAMIECLDRDDWDEIKVEPDTENDKVDIMLYSKGVTLSAIQVKSSQYPFGDKEVKAWLENLKQDAPDVKKYCLYLVGNRFTKECSNYILKQRKEIEVVKFDHLTDICTGKLARFVKDKGLGAEVTVDNLDLIADSLFAKIHKNSIDEDPMSRAAIEEAFQRAILSHSADVGIHAIPQSLTPVPPINKKVGLVGRDIIVQKAKDMLEEGDYTALVTGLGGIGKTAVMQKVCNDLFNNKKYVAWFKWEDSLKSGLLLLRDELRIPAEVPADEAYAQVVNVIKTKLPGKLYLFIDDLSRILNADERNELNGLRAHVMVTARFEDDYFKSLPLDVLEKEAIIDMFYKYYGGDEERRYKDTVWNIIESFNSHTLLVELLAKAARKKGGSLETFRDELKNRGLFKVFEGEIWSDHDVAKKTIEESVIKLYEISRLSEEQQRIMKLFTIFTPEKEIFYKVREWAEFDIDAIDELVELGWLEQGGEENGYHIHQIVKDSLARQIGEDVDLDEYGELLDNINSVDEYLIDKVMYGTSRERIVLTEDVATYLWKKWQAYEAEWQDANQGWFSYARALLNEVIILWKKWIACEGILKDNDKDLFCTAGALFNNLALVHRHYGDLEKSLEYSGKALAIYRCILSPEHPEMAATYNCRALVYHAKGDYKKAIKYYNKALSIFERVLGQNNPNTSIVYNNMAQTYHEQGHYEEALKYFKKALDIRERVFGPNYILTVNMYYNMARLFVNQGNYEKALEYSRKTLTILEQEIEPNQILMATTYDNIAIALRGQGDYKKALEYEGKALAMFERVLGTEHPDTAMIYNNIALVHEAQSDYEKALEYYGKALAIRERVLGTDHPDTATTHNNMAWVYRDQGDFKTALYYYKKAYDIRLRKLGENHPDTKCAKLSIEFVESKLK